MARCPDKHRSPMPKVQCAGKMTYNNMMKQMVCNSCGLSLTRHDLDMSWQKVRTQNISEADDSEKKKNKRKDWLDWYSSSKTDKENY